MVDQGFKSTGTVSRLNGLNERRQVLQAELTEINAEHGFGRRHFKDFFDHLLATVNMAEGSPQDTQKKRSTTWWTGSSYTRW
jgi:hypothetical protein